MTNNQLTKEWLQQTIAELESVRDEIPFGIDTNSELELAAFKMALAAMDSEPVAYAWVSRSGKKHLTRCEPEQWRDAVILTPLYRHAQPAPELAAIVERLNLSGYEYEGGEVTPQNAAAIIDILLQQLDDAVQGRNTQPAPVVPEEMTPEMMRAVQLNSELGEYAASNLSGAYGLFAEFWKVACRAAMLQSELVTTANKLGNSPEQGESRCGTKGSPALDSSSKNAESRCGNSPVIPAGYVMVPMRLTAENGAKGALSGEFSETQFVNCSECFGDDECETCDGSGRIEIKVPVSWTTIKEIWIKSIEHFAAAPQENN